MSERVAALLLVGPWLYCCIGCWLFTLPQLAWECLR